LFLAKSVSNPLMSDPLGGSDPLNDPLASPAQKEAPVSPTIAAHLAKSSSNLAHLTKSSSLLMSKSSSITPTPNSTDEVDYSFVPWKSKKAGILHEFTTDELVGITVVSTNG
jgi:hypothetical protein